MSLEIAELCAEALQLPDTMDAVAEQVNASTAARIKAEERLEDKTAALLLDPSVVNGSNEERRRAQVRGLTVTERAAVRAACERESEALRQLMRLQHRHRTLLAVLPVLAGQGR
jgi:hypothetical protein